VVGGMLQLKVWIYCLIAKLSELMESWKCQISLQLKAEDIPVAFMQVLQLLA